MMPDHCDHNGMPVELPDWVDTGKLNRLICMDECIVPVIKALWDAGFETLGCCCGHGAKAPSVIIPEHYGDADVEKMPGVICSVESDGRAWEIYQWKLVKV